MSRAHEPHKRTTTSPSFDPISLPILGEPLPVELANTWYSDSGTMIDLLAAVRFRGHRCCDVVAPPSAGHGCRIGLSNRPDVIGPAVAVPLVRAAGGAS